MIEDSMNNHILEDIKQIKPEMKENFGITKLALFGLYSREEARNDSDIDIAIIEIDRKNRFLVAKAKDLLVKNSKKWLILDC